MRHKLEKTLSFTEKIMCDKQNRRQAPQESIDLLKKVGLHKAFLPKANGDYEISLPEFGDCIASLAGTCASTAWAFSLLCTHNPQIALFSKQAQDDV